MIWKFIPRQLFVLFCLFYYEHFLFVNGNEHLSNCYISDEMLCLCVGFEKSNLQCFKFKNIIQVAFQIIICFLRDKLERKLDWYGLNVFDLSLVFHNVKEESKFKYL